MLHVALLLSLIKGNFECFRAYKKKNPFPASLNTSRQFPVLLVQDLLLALLLILSLQKPFISTQPFLLPRFILSSLSYLFLGNFSGC